VFSRVKSTLDPGFHRGDEHSVIFSHLPFNKGRGWRDLNRQGFRNLAFKFFPLTLPLSPSGEREEVRRILTFGIDF
jgi:hypothetical protein